MDPVIAQYTLLAVALLIGAGASRAARKGSYDSVDMGFGWHLN